MTRRRAAAAISATLALAALTACTVAPPQPAGTRPPTSQGVPTSPGGPTSAPPSTTPPLPVERPNIVLILTDDLSSNLVPHMQEVEDLARDGVSFDDFIVTDPQCCPSRASTLTGKFPHNTNVLSNGWPNGGFGRFTLENEDRSLGPYLQAAGYRTGFMGKYLNGYDPTGRQQRGQEGAPLFDRGYVPPGWDEWHVAGRKGYGEFGYALGSAVDEPVATIERFGFGEDDYLTDVLAERAEDFIDRAAAGGSDQADPFFLEIATFSTHSGKSDGTAAADSAVPIAPRDRTYLPGDIATWPKRWEEPTFTGGDCGDADDGGCAAVQHPAPDDVHGTESFNVVPRRAPDWMPKRGLDEDEVESMHAAYVGRVQMAQSLDELVGRVRDQLAARGLADSTYLVFNSDNGFHLGEHGLSPGKTTAYDHDVRVPLIVLPPDGSSGTPGRTVDAITQNTDLLPTFLEMAGATIPRDVDGRSLVPLLVADDVPDDWRRAALVQFEREQGEGNPRLLAQTYQALRTEDYLFTDYRKGDGLPRAGQAELYDLVVDPGQVDNRYTFLGRAERQALVDALARYAACRGASCERAARAVPDVEVPAPRDAR